MSTQAPIPPRRPTPARKPRARSPAMAGAPILDRIQIVVLVIATLWAVEAMNFLVGHELNRFGIEPRDMDGLIGIPLWAFLHGGPMHLGSNTGPLIVLMLLQLGEGFRRFVVSTAAIIIASGLMVWIFARDGLHVGASGLIFGYLGYLIASAFYGTSLPSVVTAVVVVALYGGILLSGIVPRDTPVSWEGHLAGLIAGLVTARVMHKK